MPAAAPSTFAALGSSGAGGASFARPTSTSTFASPRPTANGATPAASHTNQRPTGSRRRRDRASASIEASSAGRISAAVSIDSAQPGTTRPASVT
jgi:hypothetical protein